MNLRLFENVDDLISAAGRAVLQRIESGARTIGLSGGSTPKPLYARLGREEALRQLPLTWVLVDERYVPIDDPQSNAGMIEKTLFAAGRPEAHRFLRFRTELGDPATTARAFEDDWKRAGLHTLDLALLGMGDDGHTASLFPGTSALEVEDAIATAVFVPRLDSWRVTLTESVLRSAGARFVLAAGASKRPVLQQIRQGADFPIARVTRDVETWWFVDQAAAGDEPAGGRRPEGRTL